MTMLEKLNDLLNEIKNDPAKLDELTKQYERFLYDNYKKKLQSKNKPMYFLKKKRFLPTTKRTNLEFITLRDCKPSNLRLHELTILDSTENLKNLKDVLHKDSDFNSHWELNGKIYEFVTYVITDEYGKELFTSTMENEIFLRNLQKVLMSNIFHSITDVINHVKDNLILDNEVLLNVYTNEDVTKLYVETDKNKARTNIFDCDGIICADLDLYVI